MKARAVRSRGDRSGDRELGARGQVSKSPSLAEVLDDFRVPAFAVGRGDAIAAPPQKSDAAQLRHTAFDGDRAEVVRRRLSEVQHAVEARQRQQRAALALGNGRKAVAAADDAHRCSRAADRGT